MASNAAQDERARPDAIYGHPSLLGLAAEALRVNANGLYVEVVDPTGRPVPPGQEGRILVTDLRDRTTPLIRYEVGDSGASASGRCARGRGLPLLERVDCLRR